MLSTKFLLITMLSLACKVFSSLCPLVACSGRSIPHASVGEGGAIVLVRAVSVFAWPSCKSKRGLASIRELGLLTVSFSGVPLGLVPVTLPGSMAHSRY